MENKVIEFLPVEEFKVLKVIKVVGNEWNKFSGYLPYIRKFDSINYDSKIGDETDEKILTILRNSFPNSNLWINEEILFKGQLDNLLKSIEGGSRKLITIQFAPLISFNEAPGLAGQTFHAYPFGFDLRLQMGEDKEKMDLINDYFICNVPYKKIDEIIKTIKPI